MNSIRCTRKFTNCNRVIEEGELYRTITNYADEPTRYCCDCAKEVFGPRWAVEEHASIARLDTRVYAGIGVQIEWETRKVWAAAIDLYLDMKALAEVVEIAA